jgi:murein L,D-transpeptidase YcbB/YkuD
MADPFGTAVPVSAASIAQVQQRLGVTADGITGPVTLIQMLEYAGQQYAQMQRDYSFYRELYATTGDEAAFSKMLDCVTME